MTLLSTLKRRAAALLLAAALLSGCAGGAGQSQSGIVADSGPVSHNAAPTPVQVRLPYFPDDNLNPYSCQTLQNYYLAGLLFDPLVALDSSNKPVNRLALEIVSADHLSYTVTLRGDAVFSDGSLLTAQDVLYSLGLAQTSPRFAAGLRGVVSATAGSESMLTITLAEPDRFFARSLCFPILRDGTGEQPIPVGVGRFAAQLDQSLLARNEAYYSPVKNIRQVTLVATNSLEEQSYGIMEGTVDLMYSDLQSDLNLGLGVGYRQIPLSNLVFLGVNHARAWATQGMRQAISGLIRREDIVRKAYTGFAAVTSIPISPVNAATALAAADLEVHLDKQKLLLESLGWAAQEDGSRKMNGITLHLTLLVNSGNNERQAAAELIAEMLRLGGIQITLEALPYEQYAARIAAGEYDLCIAETRLAYNMDIASLILPGDTAASGNAGANSANSESSAAGSNPAEGAEPASSEASGASGETPASSSEIPVASPATDASLTALYAGVRAGTAEQSALETLLRERLPVIPLLFRRGILCFSRDFSANIVATEQDIFYNIGEW